jgi:hypothetical protein
VRKYGVAPDILYDVMTEGLLACSAYKIYGKIITEERYLPAGFAGLLCSARNDSILMLPAHSAPPHHTEEDRGQYRKCAVSSARSITP